MGTKELGLSVLGGVGATYVTYGVLSLLKQNDIIPGIPALKVTADFKGYGLLDGTHELTVGVQSAVGLLVGVLMYLALLENDV